MPVNVGIGDGLGVGAGQLIVEREESIGIAIARFIVPVMIIPAWTWHRCAAS